MLSKLINVCTLSNSALTDTAGMFQVGGSLTVEDSLWGFYNQAAEQLINHVFTSLWLMQEVEL